MVTSDGWNLNHFKSKIPIQKGCRKNTEAKFQLICHNEITQQNSKWLPRNNKTYCYLLEKLQFPSSYWSFPNESIELKKWIWKHHRPNLHNTLPNKHFKQTLKATNTSATLKTARYKEKTLRATRWFTTTYGRHLFINFRSMQELGRDIIVAVFLQIVVNKYLAIIKKLD